MTTNSTNSPNTDGLYADGSGDSNNRERIDHDQLFKLLTEFFAEFVTLFFPALAAQIEPGSREFLDKELFTDITAGRAARPTHEWAAQFPIAALPPHVHKGKWQVYALIHVEKAPDTNAESVAFTAGIYDSAAQTRRGDVSILVANAGAVYQPYLLGTVEAGTDQYVWIAPAANPGVKAVWVDRLYFVPVPR